jgi:propionyl-CoA carboxylase alpha chain/3-methylcrotonyl-CoA carboxylase alpha subunit
VADAAREAPEASPWSGAPGGLFGFRLNAPARSEVRLEQDGAGVSAALGATSADAWTAEVDGAIHALHRSPRGWAVDGTEVSTRRVGEGVVAFHGGRALLFTEVSAAKGAEAAGDGVVLSPMPGKVILISVAVGDAVRKGQALLTLEAMKMEHVLTAAFDGVVAALGAKEGDQVAEGVTLARLDNPA